MSDHEFHQKDRSTTSIDHNIKSFIKFLCKFYLNIFRKSKKYLIRKCLSVRGQISSLYRNIKESKKRNYPYQSLRGRPRNDEVTKRNKKRVETSVFNLDKALIKK